MSKIVKVEYRRRPIEEIDAYLKDKGLSVSGTESERRIRAKTKRANLSAAGIRSRRKHALTEKRTASRRRRQSTPEAKAKAAVYNKRPEVRARNLARVRLSRALEKSSRPSGKLAKVEQSIHNVAKPPRRGILFAKGSEIARLRGGLRIQGEDYKKAVKWFNSLDDKTRLDFEGKFARRRGAIDKRIAAFLKSKKVTAASIEKFLSGGIEYHHFNEVLLGPESADKFFSAEFIDKNLHKVIHRTLRERYADELRHGGISSSERLQRLLKSGDPTRKSRLPKRGLLHHTSEIQNYNPLRKGTIPPYLRIIAENSFGKKEAKNMMDEILYISQGTDTPSHRAGERVPKNFKSSKAIRSMIGKGFSVAPWAIPATLTGMGLTAFYPEESRASMVGENLIKFSDPLGTMLLGGPSMTRNPNFTGLLGTEERRMVDPTWPMSTAINTPPQKKRPNIWS